MYHTSYTQQDIIRKVDKLLEKEKCRQPIQLIYKSITKNSTNVTAYQASALYYTTPANSNYNLDSAHHQNLKAIYYYDKLDEKKTPKIREERFWTCNKKLGSKLSTF